MEKRVLTFNIESRDAGVTVKQYLMRTLGFSSHQLGRLKFREDGICVNGKRVYVNFCLREGDILTVRLTQQARDPDRGDPQKIWLPPAEDMAARFPPRILYEDEDLLIMNKPSGIVCHPSFGHFCDTLANQAAEHLGGVGTSMEIRVTGRLDRETSGIVVFAKNTETAAQLQKQRQTGEVRKIYLALTKGEVPCAEGAVRTPIRREAPGLHRMVTAPDGKEAATFYRVIGRREISGSPGRYQTLLICRIEHGRMHQIRVHMASIGCPLAGDRLYNPKAEADTEMGPAIGLHAWRLSFRQPFTGKQVEIEAPAPDWARKFPDCHGEVSDFQHVRQACDRI